jgi:hypothetical protein
VLRPFSRRVRDRRRFSPGQDLVHPGALLQAYKLRTASFTGPNSGFNSLFTKGCQFENSQCGSPGFGLGVDAEHEDLVGYVRDGIGAGSEYINVIFSSAKVVDLAFHHVALVVNRAAGNLELYFDGLKRQDSLLDSAFGSVDSTFKGTLCAEVDETRTLDGTVDEVMIFGRALDTTEVLALSARR